MRPSPKGLFLVLAWALLASGVALADQVVYFTNGTSMQVQGHTLEGTMIRVDLGGGAVLGFPRTMVERVEDRGKNVYTNPAFAPANQAIASGSGGTSPDRDTTAIAGTVPGSGRYRVAGPRRPGGVDGSDPLVQAAFGEQGAPAVPRPEVASAGGGRIKIRGRMNNGTVAPDGPIGAVPQGNNYVMDAPGGTRGGVQVMRMAPRTGEAAAPPPSSEPPPADGASDDAGPADGGDR